MDQSDYYKLLHGEGSQCRGTTDLMYLPRKGKSIEERSMEKICPPTHLNPGYKPDPKVKRSGQLPKQPKLQGRAQVDPAVLRRILS